MIGARHPLDVLLAALSQAFEAELARQDGTRADLPALAGGRRRGGLAELREEKRREADQRPPRAA